LSKKKEMTLSDHFKKSIPKEDLEKIKEINGLLSPEQAFKLVMTISNDIIKALAEGKEVLIGSDGEYEKYEIKHHKG